MGWISYKLHALLSVQVEGKATPSTLTQSSTTAAPAGAPPSTTRPCVQRAFRFHCSRCGASRTPCLHNAMHMHNTFIHTRTVICNQNYIRPANSDTLLNLLMQSHHKKYATFLSSCIYRFVICCTNSSSLRRYKELRDQLKMKLIQGSFLGGFSMLAVMCWCRCETFEFLNVNSAFNVLWFIWISQMYISLSPHTKMCSIRPRQRAEVLR